jgi:hypothetical protein
MIENLKNGRKLNRVELIIRKFEGLLLLLLSSNCKSKGDLKMGKGSC